MMRGIRFSKGHDHAKNAILVTIPGQKAMGAACRGHDDGRRAPGLPANQDKAGNERQRATSIMAHCPCRIPCAFLVMAQEPFPLMRPIHKALF
jgi:hypothetical protein